VLLLSINCQGNLEIPVDNLLKVWENRGDNEKLNWTRDFSLNTNKSIFVPAQLVYLLCKFRKNEPVINFSISTGALVGK